MTFNSALPQITDDMTEAQANAIEAIFKGGGISPRNAFLDRACKFYLEPLGLSFELAEYDFFSALESNCYPSFRGLAFSHKDALKFSLYESLFTGLSLAPEGVVFEIGTELPYPIFSVNMGSENSDSLWDLEARRSFEMVLDEGIVDLINREIVGSCQLLKLTLDAGFQMLLDPIEGESHARAFSFDADDFLERVKAKLAPLQE